MPILSKTGWNTPSTGNPNEGRIQVITRESGDRPGFGSVPDFGAESSGGYAISGVTKGGPAELGGLKAGDKVPVGREGSAVGGDAGAAARLKDIERG